ncbi:ABC transporter ATP-binding protein [Pseudobutyrivibrio xylanivorans]|uniref:Peptide/nickel transport system ATP-binding protein n=1 Tax=Pseudobutyrivibrio xylanivorans TaxID=185007 RepID=A0A1G5S598_PSEXY|nr:ABC transporter ATP-binding protein [Pseudobutyrivibrio xylanivorans]SCZ81020.1 peptide/nickel transport system ATP-binding protein [Pseudobutyrivibrio xylanivorans]
MEEMITVKNVSKNFINRGSADTLAVKDISFTLERGETLGIVGESGSGKSTVARLITGLISPTSGEIRICDNDIQKQRCEDPLGLYSNIQMVFQNPVESFNPRKTLGYGIDESLRNRGISPSAAATIVAQLLEKVGLTPDFSTKYPHQVSGGQCQRAAIARALAVEPRILICDEATSALDVTVQKQIIELLDELRRTRDLSIIFICHNLALVQSFCDRVIVLYDGEIVEQGKPDDIINNPQAEYTKLLVDSIL